MSEYLKGSVWRYDDPGGEAYGEAEDQVDVGEKTFESRGECASEDDVGGVGWLGSLEVLESSLSLH